MWWLHQCKDTPAYQELAKEQMSEGAIQHGVEALRLKSLMMTYEFTAREKSRACAEKASPRQAAQTGSRLRDLLKMQSRDPTMPVYKSGMVVKGLEALQKWAK